MKIYSMKMSKEKKEMDEERKVNLIIASCLSIDDSLGFLCIINFTILSSGCCLCLK